MVDDRARPPVGDDELQFREILEHLTRKPRPLLGDHEDVVVGQFLGESRGSDRLAIEPDLGVASEGRPIAELFGAADVVV